MNQSTGSSECDLRRDMESLSMRLWEEGVRATARHSFTQGSTLRMCANQMREVLDLPPLPYEAGGLAERDTRPEEVR